MRPECCHHLFLLILMAFKPSFTSGTSCPWSWVSYGSFCYKHMTRKIKFDWWKCKQFCESFAAQLVSIHSADENRFITTLGPPNYWLGLTSAFGGGYSKWLDGTRVTFTNWSPREPSGGTEKFAVMYASGKWNDNPANIAFHFVCKTTATIQRKDVFNAKFTADDQLEFIVDGVELPQEPAEKLKITTAKTFWVPWYTNVLAIKGINLGGGKGIIGYVNNGIVTDTSWKCTSRLYRDWTNFDVNDIFWPNAVVQNHGSWPILAILPEASWIWAGSQSSPVYCRKTIHGNPIAIYPFDGIIGAKDVSLNDRPTGVVSVVGNLTFTEGILGEARGSYNLTAESNTSIILNDKIPPAKTDFITIMLWVFPEKNCNGQLLDGGVQLFFGNRTVRARLHHITLGYVDLISNNLEERIWHSIAVTYNSSDGNATLIVDDKIADSRIGSLGVLAPLYPIRVGHSSAPPFYQGRIACLQLYDAVFSTKKIASMKYNCYYYRGVDIDECTLGLFDCHPIAKCRNIPMSYECDCLRPPLTGDGYINCSDVDECAAGIHSCHAMAYCNNTIGSYNCTCKTGFYGNGFLCEDVNECNTGTDDCDKSKELCYNTMGSFLCLCKYRFDDEPLGRCTRNPPPGLPFVKIISIKKDAVFPSLITRSEETYFEGLIQVNGYSNKGGQLLWTIRNVVSYPFNISTNSVIVSTESSQWNVKKLSLQIGLYLVECKLQLPSNYGFSSNDYGFLNVTQSPLVALITGGSEIVRSGGTLFNLDGSLSRDPDTRDGDFTGIYFTWYCRKGGVTSSENFMVNKEMVKIAALGSSIDNKGCFGNDNERLIYNVTVVNIAGNSLGFGHSYSFELQIKKDKRSVSYLQTVHVVMGNPPQISISCLINCGPQVIASSQLSLTSSCTGATCKDLTYQWGLYVKNNQSTEQNRSLVEWKVLTDLDSGSRTKLSFPNLVIKANYLKRNEHYRVVVRALPLSDNNQTTARVGFAAYEFVTTSPPTMGDFRVSPELGVSLITLFDLRCFGWEDDDTPLLYEFYIRLEHGLENLLFYGNLNLSSVRLPPGEAEMEAVVVDRVGEKEEKKISVMVLRHPSMYTESYGDVETAYLTDTNSLLNIALQEDNLHKAVQVVTAFIKNMEENQFINKTERTRICEYVVRKFSAVQIENLQRLVQVSAAVGIATYRTEDMSNELIASSLNETRKMVFILRDKAKERSASQIRLVKTASSNLLVCLSNIIRAASVNITVHSNKRNLTESQLWIKGLEKQASAMIKIILRSLLYVKLPYEDPTVLSTVRLSVLVQRLAEEQLSGLMAQLENSSFTLPKTFNNETARLIGDNVAHIDVQMSLTTFNPYTWDASVNRVRSHVVGIDLVTNETNTLNISDLESNIDIRIPVPPQDNELPNQAFYNKPGKLGYHYFDVQFPETLVDVRLPIKKESTKSLVYVKYNQRPTVQDFDFNITLPDFSSCSYSSSEGWPNYDKCSVHPYTIVKKSFDKPGRYYIGILIDRSNATARVRRSCFGGRRKKRSCIEVKEPPRDPSTGKFVDVVPERNVKEDENYTLSINQGSCVYWSVENENWTTEGCVVGDNSTLENLQCLCNHLTSFGGDMFVAPNPIDFDQIWVEFSNLDSSGNVAVLVTVCVMFLIYVVAVIFARKADKKDKLKVGPAVILPHPSAYTCSYNVKINTGVWMNSGTTSNVAFIVIGSEGDSGIVEVSKIVAESGRVFFERGSEDRFTIFTEKSLGSLLMVHVAHDNSGTSPCWFLNEITIEDCQTETTWVFPCVSWLAVERGDGCLERLLRGRESQQKIGFRHEFNERTTRSFADSHLWFSVATKQPSNGFTRVQRLSCCLLLIFSSMVVNAMFYEIGGASEETIQVGPLKLSLRQVMIGIQSALIVAPLNIFVAILFRKSKTGNGGCCCNSNTKRSEGKYFVTNSQNHLQSVQSKDDSAGDRPLPHFFVYIAWFLSISSVLVSAAFTLFYSLAFGKEKAEQWLSSMLISFFQDVFISQPGKIILLALIFALFYELKAKRNNSEKGEPLVETENERSILSLLLPDELEHFRSYKVKERKFYSFLTELVFFIVFLLLLTIVVYGDRDEHAYSMTKAVHESFANVEGVQSRDLFWEWLGGDVIPVAFSRDWYNGDKEEISAFMENKRLILLGMPRLRQLRVKSEHCRVPDKYAGPFKYCQEFYSFDAEDKTAYNKPGWIPVTNVTKYNTDVFEQCPLPWRYITPGDSETFVSWGKYSVYDGGGFFANLGYSQSEAYSVIESLQKSGWIDEHTRIVILEISMFSAYTNLVSVLTYYFETSPTGHGEIFQRIEIMSLYSENSATHKFYLVCQLLFIFFIFFYSIVECFTIAKQKWRYFSCLWNWISVMQLVSLIDAVVFYLLRSKSTVEAISKTRSNPFSTVSFQWCLFYLNVENIVLAFVIFLSTLKFIHLIRFNHQVMVLASTFRRATQFLMPFSIIFLLLFFNFALFGLLVFGSNMSLYSTFIKSLSSLFETLLGQGVPIYEMSEVNWTIAAIYVFGFVFSMAMILTNMFVVILNDAQAKSSTDDENPPDHQMGEFIHGKVWGIFAKTENNNRDDLKSLTKDETATRSRMYKFGYSTEKRQEEGEINNVNADIASSIDDNTSDVNNESANGICVPKLVQLFEEFEGKSNAAVNKGFESDDESLLLKEDLQGPKRHETQPLQDVEFIEESQMLICTDYHSVENSFSTSVSSAEKNGGIAN